MKVDYRDDDIRKVWNKSGKYIETIRWLAQVYIPQILQNFLNSRLFVILIVHDIR